MSYESPENDNSIKTVAICTDTPLFRYFQEQREQFQPQERIDEDLNMGGEGNEERLFRCFIEASNNGNYAATLNCALCYFNGIGTAENQETAIELLKFLVDNEDCDGQVRCNAQVCYGCCLLDQGQPEEAVEYFKSAALQGSSISQYYLAFCAFNGMGTKQDQELATDLYNRTLVPPSDMQYLPISMSFIKSEELQVSMKNFNAQQHIDLTKKNIDLSKAISEMGGKKQLKEKQQSKCCLML